jgi:hypothetical protein
MCQLIKVYQSKPFAEVNADKIALKDILNLYIEPFDTLIHPFDYKDTIIKGCRGSGKTMFLRANHAYYLYTLVPSLIDNSELVLPIYIHMNDFQHLKDAGKIYNKFIVKAIEELISISKRLQDAEQLAEIHQGMSTFLPFQFPNFKSTQSTFYEMLKLNSDEYKETISRKLLGKAGLKNDIFEASIEYQKESFLEIQKKPDPSIADIEKAYKEIFGDREHKILFLLDEVSSLSKLFFKEGKNNSSFFEILMNQLRTQSFLKTKIAIYPNTYSDILTESCYGDIVNLQEDVRSKEEYDSFRKKTILLLDKYISCSVGEKYEAKNLFFIKENENQVTDSIEQLIFASNGNIRRFLKLAEQSMDKAFSSHKGTAKVFVNHVTDALKRNATELIAPYDDIEKEFLEQLGSVCKKRGTYIFQCPNQAPLLSKFVNRSSEHNVININRPGSGKRGTIYSFDYAYCVFRDIPTHCLKDCDQIDVNRSLISGKWISKVTLISQKILKDATESAKKEGVVFHIQKDSGVIKDVLGTPHYWKKCFMVDQNEFSTIEIGTVVRFYPLQLDDSLLATFIEVNKT